MRHLEPSADGAVFVAVVRGNRWKRGENEAFDEATSEEPTDGGLEGASEEPGDEELASLAITSGLSRGDVVVGVPLWQSRSDAVPGAPLPRDYGPQLLPLALLRERERQADLWLDRRAPAAAAGRQTFLVMNGMGDGFLLLGGLGNASFVAPFTFRTRSGSGPHSHRIGGVLLGRVGWDERTCVELDLSDATLDAARAALEGSVPDPQLVLAAHYDSRS